MLIEKYSNICSAAGDEDEIRKSVREDIDEYVDEITVNPLGNLIARTEGRNRDKSVLLTAHMDEVAFIVKSIDKNGLIKFYPIGGLMTKILIGNPVVIGKKKIPGIIGHKSYHLMSSEERKKVPDQKDLSIDIGASTRDEVKDISPGDYIYFRSDFFCQGNHYYGKAFDDRAGCAALTEILKDYQKNERPGLNIIATYTVQEEVGLRGGATAAYGYENLLLNLNLEGTTCSDRELKKTYSPSTKSGEGPAITFMDKTSIAQRKLVDFIISIAEKYGIQYQFKKTVTGGTDSGLIHITEKGVPSVTVSVPVRYIHSPWGIIHRQDFDNFVSLAKAVVKEAVNF